MTKLVHSPEAYLRYIHMSQAQALVFVEGRDPDPYVYGKIAERVLAPTKTLFQVCRAEEVGAIGAGGKQALLRFFEFLNDRDSLGGNFKGKRWFALFFLDKDVDDLLGIAKTSSHISYTTYYDIENHIYAAGDLREAAAASASIPVQEAPEYLANSNTWRARAAQLWRDWVLLCLLVSRTGASCACGYSLKSCLNNPPNAEPANGIEGFLEEIKKRTMMDDAPFAELLSRTQVEVEAHYNRGEFDKIFKGKWYASILHADLLKHLSGRVANRNALEIRLTPAIAQSLAPDGAWAEAFSVPLTELVAEFILQ